MFRKYLTCFLIVLLLNVQLLAQTKDDKKAEKEAARVAQLKTAMNAVGMGDTFPVELKLKSAGKLTGYISAMKDGSIVFAETVRATTREISYTEITSVKAYNPPSAQSISKKKTIFWITVAAVGITALAILGYKHCKKLEREGKVCLVDDTTN